MALNWGADANSVTFRGESVFMLACQAKQCEEICLRLLEGGADPNVSDPVCLNVLFALNALFSVSNMNLEVLLNSRRE